MPCPPALDLELRVPEAVSLGLRETPDPLCGPGEALPGVAGDARERSLERVALVEPAALGREVAERASVCEQRAVSLAAHVGDDLRHPGHERLVRRRIGAGRHLARRHEGEQAHAPGSRFASPPRRVKASARRSSVSATDASDTPERRSRASAK